MEGLLNSSANRVPEGACCFANFGGALFPKKDIAYKRLDVRVAKTFKMPWGHELTADFEAFNVFNWLNRIYSTWGGRTAAAHRERPGRQRPAAVPGRLNVQVLNLLDGIGRGTLTSPSFLFGTSPK
jgi:hypothetical protein